MFKLQINGENVELNSKESFKLFLVNLLLNDFSKRGITISNQVNLPLSSLSQKSILFPGHINSNNKSFEERQKYTLTLNQNIVSTGTVIVVEHDPKKGTKIQLAEGDDFWTIAGRDKLNDLILYDEDFVFEAASFTTLKAKTNSPWLWALDSEASDTGETALNDLVFSRPQYRIKTLIDKIVSSTGYTIDYGSLLDGKLDNLGFTANHNGFKVTDYRNKFINVSVSNGILDLGVGSIEFSKAGNTADIAGELVNQLYSQSWIVKGFISSVFDTKIEVIIEDSSGGFKSQFINIYIGENFVNLNTDDIEIGSKVTFNLQDPLLFRDVRIYPSIDEGKIFDVSGSFESSPGVSILDGFLVLSDYNLPDLLQSELVKIPLKQLFIKLDIDDLAKEITLSSFQDIISTNIAYDISGKIQEFPPIKSGKTFAQLNIFSYKNDDDIPSSLGSAFYRVDNENAKEAKEFLSIEMSASNEVLVSTNSVIDLPVYNIADVSRNDIDIRICLFQVGTGINFRAEFTGINWQTLLDENYVLFLNKIRRERLLTLKGVFTATDFKAMKKTPVIFVAEINAYLFISETEGFSPGELTTLKCVLLLEGGGANASAQKLLLLETFSTIVSTSSIISVLTTFLAQTIISPVYHSDMCVNMYVRSITGAPDGDIICEICETIAGIPDYTTIVGTSSNTIAATSLVQNSYQETFNFSGLSLVNNDQYAIVFRYTSVVTLDGSNNFQFMVNKTVSDIYVDGTEFISLDSGASWLFPTSRHTDDIKLKVLYTP